MRCLEKDPDRRPQNAQQILTALEDPAVLSGELDAVDDYRRSDRRAERERLVASAIALVVAVVASVVAAVAIGVAHSTRIACVSSGSRGRAGRAERSRCLPFVELGSDSGKVAAEAIQTELTNALARDRRVRVASSNTAVALQKRLSLGQKVNDAVTLYVEGVVQREANRVRVDARMVNAADGFMVWAQSYEGNANQLLSLRTEIGNAVAEAAAASQLGLPDRNRPAPTKTETRHDAVADCRGVPTWSDSPSSLASLAVTFAHYPSPHDCSAHRDRPGG